MQARLIRMRAASNIPTLRRAWGSVFVQQLRYGSVSTPASPLGAVSARKFSDSHSDFQPKANKGTLTPELRKLFEQDVSSNTVFLYMKGRPDAPQCGFSRRVCMVLDHLGVEYKSRNILESEEVRNGLKVFSDWPTFPQLYVKKEFIGGCDIVFNMFQEGELQDLFKKNNIEMKGPTKEQ